MKNPLLRLAPLTLLLLLGALPLHAARPKKPLPPPPAAPEASAPVRCNEEPAASGIVFSDADPRSTLITLAESAQQRSRQVGAAQLLEAAARDEIREAQAERLPRVMLNAMTVHGGSVNDGVSGQRGLEARLGLQLNGPLWDWGRTRQLIEYRAQLAEVAAATRNGIAEQVALQTVALSLDRGRYALQAQVYGQYVRKMSCLVEQLQGITRFDQGRASELTQAQKSQQQAELLLATVKDQLQNTETRLRRLVGDPLPPLVSMSAVLARLPELPLLQKDLLQAADVSAANAQALAASRLAEAVAAGQKPQLGYLASGNIARGNGRDADWVAGVQLSIPLFQAGDEPQRAAALRRAEAANLQRDETLDQKTWRLQELHDAAGNSLDRARRITELLRASNNLRGATLQQWQQLGRRSLFDVMAAEADYYALRVAHVNALYDAQQAVALMTSMGRGVLAPLR